MSFKALRNLKETPEQQARAAEGFEARLKEHERRFTKARQALEPTERFYRRSYFPLGDA